MAVSILLLPLSYGVLVGGGTVDVHYGVGPGPVAEGVGRGSGLLLRRQEELALGDAPAGERVALQEAISLIRFGVADRLRVPRETCLGKPVTRAVVCAEVMALGASVSIGGDQLRPDTFPGRWEGFAYEAARERHRLLPPPAGGDKNAYIRRGRPTDAENARLAHKLVREMGYSQAEVARIFEWTDTSERPAMWTRKGVGRLLRMEDDGDLYRTEPSTTERRAKRLDSPVLPIDIMAVLGGTGALPEAEEFDAALGVRHACITRIDAQALPAFFWLALKAGVIRTLYVTDPGAVFSSRLQRDVVYDLALFGGVQVVENGAHIPLVSTGPEARELLREGTELSVALWTRDRATIAKEPLPLTVLRTEAAQLRSAGHSFQQIATDFNARRIPTTSGRGSWHASTIKELLASQNDGIR
ncbi:hypothetical protein ACFRFJ_28170 [Streptomyces hydrogenans]|uniref:hypothetical protein n=1 Tax=Streptomyces hydrogenans TaxID=1873719 RepID=UPI003679A82A